MSDFIPIDDGYSDFETAYGSSVGHNPHLMLQPKRCHALLGKMKVRCKGWKTKDSDFCVGHKRAMEKANDDSG